MNIRSIVLSAATLFLVTGCSNQIRVKSDYDKDVNLRLYKTFSWLPVKDIEAKNNPLLYNELTDKRIKKALEMQLTSKNMSYLKENADLKVHYHIIVDNKSMIQPAAYGYNYGPYWMRTQGNVYQYQEGTLIIDLMDSKNNNLVWRGWGISTLNDSDIELTEDKINEAVYKIMKQFPPTKK